MEPTKKNGNGNDAEKWKVAKIVDRKNTKIEKKGKKDMWVCELDSTPSVLWNVREPTEKHVFCMKKEYVERHKANNHRYESFVYRTNELSEYL